MIPGGAGKLNQVCDFQLRTFTTSARGGPVEAWNFFFTAKCNFTLSKTLKYVRMGARDIAAEDRKGLQEGVFIIRFRPGINRDDHRIVHRGRAWNISDIREYPIGKQVYYEIDVIEQIELAIEV